MDAINDTNDSDGPKTNIAGLYNRVASFYGQVGPNAFVYADAQQWWDAKWTHGTRYSLEHMSPEVLAQFKSDVFVRLQEAPEPDGIHEKLHFQFISGTKRTENNKER